MMSTMQEPAVLVAISGLPGTGKSALAEELAIRLGWPILAIDEVAERIPRVAGETEVRFWDRAIVGLLDRVGVALQQGQSVIVDHVFMNRDRFHAAAIAEDEGAVLKPIHTFMSDTGLWRSRVELRAARAPLTTGVATWDRIVQQIAGFLEWDPSTALFVDGSLPLEENVNVAIDYILTDGRPSRPLPTGPYSPGDYHQEDHSVSRCRRV